ncbi:MAG: NfeD family protein [Bacteroidota bacterium]
MKEQDFFKFIDEKFGLHTKRKKISYLKSAFLYCIRANRKFRRLPAKMKEEWYSYRKRRLNRPSLSTLDRYLFHNAVTITDCDPTGLVRVAGREMEAQANKVIQAGTKVKVYAISMGRLLIR